MLELKQLNKTFDKQKVISGLSYTFKPNAIYALMGANGSGKTILFNLIGGFLKADSGEITFKDQDITQCVPYQVAQTGIARTFQNLRIMPSLSVVDNIYLAFKHKADEKILAAFWQKTSRELYKEKIDTLLKKTHLEAIKNTLAMNISYGQ